MNRAPLLRTVALLLTTACVVQAPKVIRAQPRPIDTDPTPPAEEEPGPAEDTAAPTPPDTDPPPDDSDPPDPGGLELCFPGADLAWTTCGGVVPWDAAWGPDWEYPTSSDRRYARPLRFIDLDVWPASQPVAPNFVLSELAQRGKGRWALVQPHLVDHLQSLRDASGGALVVTSGYRNPAWNEGVGGVTFSRHQWGDAADLQPAAVDLDTLGALCEAEGAAYVGYYEAHVHCDWRDDPLEPVLFATAPAPAAPGLGAPASVAPAALSASLRRSLLGWSAPAEGWDEGEPLREWTALDARGRPLTTARGRTFLAPSDAARVRVVVGRAITLESPTR